MAEIKTPEDLPDWFNIDRYEPMSEDERKQAALAVLDRLPFYQSCVRFRLPCFSLLSSTKWENPKGVPAKTRRHPKGARIQTWRWPRGVPAKMRRWFANEGALAALVDWWLGPAPQAREEALAALEVWSADPYQRITSQWKSALQVALQPSVTAGDIAAFEGMLEREEEAERAACHLALTEAVEGVRHLPAREQLLAVQEAVQRMMEPGEEEKEWTKPVTPQWGKKLLNYYAAAYMDLEMWAALDGHTLNIRSLHDNFIKDSSQGEINARIGGKEGSVRIGGKEVSVRDFMKRLKDESILHYLTRLEKGRG